MAEHRREIVLRDVEELFRRQADDTTYAPQDTGNVESLRSELSDYFASAGESPLTVLGVDIYQYSKYKAEQQRLIPIIFRLLYDGVVNDLLTRESLLFRGSIESYYQDFIPTGDGGFQVLPTPLHAFTFALFFETHLQWFNSFVTLPLVRELVGPLTVRWAITHDSLFRFDSNYFGSAIISNARILSSDRLNRCLIEANVIDWFLRRTGNIESLAGLDVANIHEVLKIPKQDSGRSTLFQSPHPFRAIMVQKIGVTEAKGSPLDVYSLFAQVRIAHKDSEATGDLRNLVASLGNANADGLSR